MRKRSRTVSDVQSQSASSSNDEPKPKPENVAQMPQKQRGMDGTTNPRGWISAQSESNAPLSFVTLKTERSKQYGTAIVAQIPPRQ